jgi:hypothetical protein
MPDTIFTVEGVDYTLCSLLREASNRGYTGNKELVKQRAYRGCDSWEKLLLPAPGSGPKAAPLAELCAQLDARKAQIRKQQERENNEYQAQDRA